jgi:DtxR family manganese transport transcriptional regulator
MPAMSGRASRAGPLAGPFAKVRRDHATETAEDYVEAVEAIGRRRGRCRVTDLAEHMGVSHVTVTRIVARLVDEGLLATTPYRPVELTPAGSRLAAASRRRHHLVYRFLRTIGVPPAEARRDAEGIEHHVGRTTLRKMGEFVRRHGAEGADDEQR